MSLILITPPRISNGDSPETFSPLEPVSIEEVKAHCRITDDEVDGYLEGLIAAARAQVEETECWIQLLTATYELRLDSLPAGEVIEIPRPPLQEILSVKYTDEEGVEQSLYDPNVSPAIDEGVFLVENKSIHAPERAELYLDYDQSWPIPRRQRNAVRVRFKCGFGDSPADVPPSIKQWILMMCGTLNEHRETETLDSRWQESTSIKSAPGLLDAWRAKGWRG